LPNLAVTATIGWLTFAKNNRPKIEVLPPSGGGHPEGARISFGPTRVGTGPGLGGWWVF
jgi:hypothetical protein